MADNRNNRVLWILHTAVFLAGWTGIFGRLISLAGLQLVWYRILVSVVVLALVLAALGRLHRVGGKALLKIAGCGVLLFFHDPLPSAHQPQTHQLDRGPDQFHRHRRRTLRRTAGSELLFLARNRSHRGFRPDPDLAVPARNGFHGKFVIQTTYNYENRQI